MAEENKREKAAKSKRKNEQPQLFNSTAGTDEIEWFHPKRGRRGKRLKTIFQTESKSNIGSPIFDYVFADEQYLCVGKASSCPPQA